MKQRPRAERSYDASLGLSFLIIMLVSEEVIFGLSLHSETGKGTETALRENRAGVSLRGQAGTEARTEGEGGRWRARVLIQQL